jgi:hypothetical protein
MQDAGPVDACYDKLGWVAFELFDKNRKTSKREVRMNVAGSQVSSKLMNRFISSKPGAFSNGPCGEHEHPSVVLSTPS